MLSLRKDMVAAIPLFDSLMYGKIHMPEQTRERCDQGIVKYVGPEVLNIEIGDHIIFSGYTGTNIQIEGEGLMIFVPESFVECIVGYGEDNKDVLRTRISGLYFKVRSTDGDSYEYIPASYEEAMGLIAKGIEDTKWFQEITAKRKNYKQDSQRPQELVSKKK